MRNLGKIENIQKTTPELARGLVNRLHSVHGLRGAALLSEARKILQVELAIIESIERGK